MSLFNDNGEAIVGPLQPFQYDPAPRSMRADNFHVYWPGKEGAQGFPEARAQHMTPWPYATGFKRFLWPGRYGTATTLADPGAQRNLFSGALAYRPLGYVKPFTGSYSSF